MSGGWFASLGWWDQETAYRDFDTYRREPTEVNYGKAVESALPIIRVVFSTRKVKVAHTGDEDDLISAAALTITKALPKIAKKSVESIGNDKQYMRYLFTCVANSFYRELDVLHGRPNKIRQRVIEEQAHLVTPKSKIGEVEAGMLLEQFPAFLFKSVKEAIRFEDPDKKRVCEYILRQLITGREVSKPVLRLLGCSNRDFYVRYCKQLLVTEIQKIRKADGVAVLTSVESFHVDLDIVSPFSSSMVVDPSLLEEQGFDELVDMM